MQIRPFGGFAQNSTLGEASYCASWKREEDNNGIFCMLYGVCLYYMLCTEYQVCIIARNV